MREPHRKDLASHSGPESCVGGGNSAGEALTGENTGREIELRNHYSGMPTLCSEGEGATAGGADGEPPENPAESKALRMCGHSLHGKRESQAAPGDTQGRSGRATSRKPDMYAARQSHGGIVPGKRSNKDGAVPPPAETPLMESRPT